MNIFPNFSHWLTIPWSCILLGSRVFISLWNWPCLSLPSNCERSSTFLKWGAIFLVVFYLPSHPRYPVSPPPPRLRPPPPPSHLHPTRPTSLHVSAAVLRQWASCCWTWLKWYTSTKFILVIFCMYYRSSELILIPATWRYRTSWEGHWWAVLLPVYTVKFCYNAAQHNTTLHIALQLLRQSINQHLNPYKTPTAGNEAKHESEFKLTKDTHTWPSQTICRVSTGSILEKNDSIAIS